MVSKEETELECVEMQANLWPTIVRLLNSLPSGAFDTSAGEMVKFLVAVNEASVRVNVEVATERKQSADCEV